MKYFKLLALALGVVTIASCSDKNETVYNTNADVTVSMASPSVTFKENHGIVKVGVVVNGETNGVVTVTCQVAELSDNPAMADVHYLLTSETINIEEGATEGYFEVKIVDDLDPNDERQFSIWLESATGAKLGTDVTTVVTIKDNDSDPYEKLAGEWTMVYDGGKTKSVTISTFDEGDEFEGEPAYKKYIIFDGICDGAEIYGKFYLSSDEIHGTVSIPLGQPLDIPTISGYDFDKAILWALTADNYIVDEGDVVLSWNEDFRELTVDSYPEDLSDCNFYYILHDKTTGKYLIYDGVDDVTKFTR